MDGNRPELSDSVADGADRESHIDERSRERRLRRWVRRCLFAGGVTALMGVMVVLSPIPNVMYAAMDVQDELAQADYIICLGGDGGRVIEAVRLLEDGFAPTLVVTSFGEAAERMRDQAIDWGAPAGRVLVDAKSRRTKGHPANVAAVAGIDIENDTCIIVTGYTHMARARAVFEKAGYRRLIMRELRWERADRDPEGLNWRNRVLKSPRLLYEGTAWVIYWIAGDV